MTPRIAIQAPRFCERCGYPTIECERAGCPTPYSDPTLQSIAQDRTRFHTLLLYAISRLNEIVTAPERDGRELAHQSVHELYKALRGTTAHDWANMLHTQTGETHGTDRK